MIRLIEFRPFGCHICPDVSETCCDAGEDLAVQDLAECIGVLQVPIQFNDALFIISGDSGQIPLELWPSWRHEVNVISSVTLHLPSRRIRSEICCQILSSTRRIYLRLPLLTLLDMRPGMYSYLEVHSLDLPRRLERLCFGTSLCLRHPGDALNLRLLLLRRRTLNPSSWTRFTPHKKSPDPPRGFFGDSSLPSLCGPVGFRGVVPHHRPIHPELFHQRFHMDRFLMGVISFQFRVLCLRLTTATYVFTRLLASMFTILHRYVVGMLSRRLVDSTRIQDHWYPGEGQTPAGVCGAGSTSHCRKSSLLLSHDMTSLDMQIQSIRFVANRQRRV